MAREEELVQKAKEVRESLIQMAADEIDATHIEVGQIKAKDDTRKLLTVRVSGANRYVPYQGHDTSEFTVGDYWAIIFDDYGTIRLGWWVANNAGGGTIPFRPHNLLDGDAHPDTVAQGVTRGSVIVGDSTPEWNEVVIGAANRIFLSDGADAGWGQADHGAALVGLLDDDHTIYFLADCTRAFGGDPIPDGADTRSLGSATAEWRNIYVGEAGRIYVRLDQSISLYSPAAGDFSIMGTQVGIKTASPDLTGYGATHAVLSLLGSGANTFAVLELASPDLTGANRAGEIAFCNLDGGAATVARAAIRGIRDGADDAMALLFLTEATGAGYGEKWRVESGGHFRPAAADTHNIGSAAAEIANLYMGQAGGLYFRLDQSVKLYGNAANQLGLLGSLLMTSPGNASQFFAGVLDSDANWMFTFESDAGGDAFMDIRNTAGATKIRLHSDGDTYFLGGNVLIGTSALVGARLVVQSTGTADILNLHETGGVEVFTVLESGFVGLRRPTPVEELDIGASKDAAIQLYSSKDAADWLVTDTVGMLLFYGADSSSGGPGVRGFVKCQNELDATGNKWGLAFGTSWANAAAVERMRLAADGGVFMFALKSGANQGAAGAATDELWVDTGDQTIKLGV